MNHAIIGIALAMALAGCAHRPAIPAAVWRGPLSVGTNSLVRALSFTPDNQTLIVGCAGGQVNLFPVGCPAGLPDRELMARTYEIKLAQYGQRLVVTGCPGATDVFDLKTGQRLLE